MIGHKRIEMEPSCTVRTRQQGTRPCPAARTADHVAADRHRLQSVEHPSLGSSPRYRPKARAPTISATATVRWAARPCVRRACGKRASRLNDVDDHEQAMAGPAAEKLPYRLERRCRRYPGLGSGVTITVLEHLMNFLTEPRECNANALQRRRSARNGVEMIEFALRSLAVHHGGRRKHHL